MPDVIKILEQYDELKYEIEKIDQDMEKDRKEKAEGKKISIWSFFKKQNEKERLQKKLKKLDTILQW